MAKTVAKKPAVSAAPQKANKGKNLAIVALIVNWFIPGLGSIIGGETKIGAIQLIAWVVSIPLMFFVIGYFTALAVWIWALVTSIKLIKEA